MDNVRKTVVFTLVVTVLPVSATLAGFEAPVEDVYQSGSYTESSNENTDESTKRISSPRRVLSAWRQAAADVMRPHEAQKQQVVSADDSEPHIIAAGESRGMVSDASGGVLNKLDELRSEVAHLRGEMELMSHEMTRLQQQQRQMYDDMDKRFRQFKNATVSSSSDVTGFSEEPSVPANQAANAATAKEVENTTVSKKTRPLLENRVTQEEAMHVLQEQKAYKVAYSALRAKHYDDAKVQFQQYLNLYPKGAFAANAYYWLGELYLLSGNETEASNAFNTVVTKYPHSSKVADALLKKGYMYFSKDQYSEAQKIFNLVQRKYPNTAAAQLAKQRLQQLKNLSSS